MKENLKNIRETLKVIEVLEKKFNLKPNNDVDEPLLYCGVAKTDIVKEIEKEVSKYFGEPYKPAGESAFFKNFFDRFIKHVGGARKDQTLFRKDIDEHACMYCAFWPWGTKPVKTSVRIGLVCYGADERDIYQKELKGDF